MPSELTPKYLQQEETMSQESRDLIATLPKEQGWLASYLYQYQGFWYSPRHLLAVIACQKHFQFHDSDIFLVTTPKSGTTWLKALVFTLVNRSRFPLSTQNHPLLTRNPHDLIPFLEINLYVDSQIPDLAKCPEPRIFATHLPYTSLPETRKCKVVYLCRNPKDILVSLWKFTNKLKPQEVRQNTIMDAVSLFSRGVSLFGPVWEHVLQYWKLSKESPEKVLFLKYEDMKEQPVLHLRRLAEFLGCPFTSDEEKSGLVENILKMCSFQHLSSLEVNKNGKLASGEENAAFFRSGLVGDWKNHLNDETAERIDEITKDKFNGSGLTL